MSSRRIWLVALLAGVVGMAGWRLAPRSHPSAPAPPPKGQPAAKTRIVALSPALVEMIFAIGAGDDLVGVSDFTNYPPEATKLPSVGGFINPNLEAITSLRPTLVVVQGQHEKVRDWCASHGQAFVAYPLDGVDDVYHVLSDLGQRLDRSAAAEAAVVRLRGELEAVRQAVAGKPPVPVFISVGRPDGEPRSLVTCNAKAFVGQLVALAGGANVFADGRDLYPSPSQEVLTARAPQVILDLQAGKPLDAAGLKQTVADWQALPTLPAVKLGRVEVVTEDYCLMPGPRMGKLSRLFARRLHPEVADKLPAD